MEIKRTMTPSGQYRPAIIVNEHAHQVVSYATDGDWYKITAATERGEIVEVKLSRDDMASIARVYSRRGGS